MVTVKLFVINWIPGPAWRHGLPLTDQPLDDHHAYFADLDAKRLIVIAGPFLDAASGGMAIVRASTREEVVALMEADPAVLTGVFIGTLRPFYAVFGGDA